MLKSPKIVFIIGRYNHWVIPYQLTHLFPGPSPILMKFGSLVDPPSGTNIQQVSAHCHHYWWSYRTSKFSKICQNFRLGTTKYPLTRKVNQLIFKTVVPLEGGDDSLSKDMLLDDLLTHLTFQGHFPRPWPLTYIFRNTSPSIFLNLGWQVLSDVGKEHVKFGYGELGISK